MRGFEKWCDENSLERYLEMIFPEQLDEVLERSYAKQTKKQRNKRINEQTKTHF